MGNFFENQPKETWVYKCYIIFWEYIVSKVSKDKRKVIGIVSNLEKIKIYSFVLYYKRCNKSLCPIFKFSIKSSNCRNEVQFALKCFVKISYFLRVKKWMFPTSNIDISLDSKFGFEHAFLLIFTLVLILF